MQCMQSNDLLTSMRPHAHDVLMSERSTDESTLPVGVLRGREAAALLPGVTYSTLMRWARDGDVPSIQYVKGGRRFFVRQDIEALKMRKEDFLTPPQGESVPDAPSAGSASAAGEGQGVLL